jgi:hypothetical protein
VPSNASINKEKFIFFQIIKIFLQHVRLVVVLLLALLRDFHKTGNLLFIQRPNCWIYKITEQNVAVRNTE